MEYLFHKWDYIEKILAGKHLLIFCDYDGTLAPIAETPDGANISKKTKELLKNLSEISGCKIVIISGRTVKDLKNKIRLKNIIYAGNHGLEINGCGFRFKASVSKKYKSVLRTIKNDLVNGLSNINGVLLEDKGISLSVHYRMVNERDIPSVKTTINNAVLSYEENEEIKVKQGKRVFEIMPPIEWDKGKAVLLVLKKQQSLLKKKYVFPIYFGDDSTDEDAFDVLRNKAVTVFVGRPKLSKAGYYLRDTKEVAGILEHISKVR